MVYNNLPGTNLKVSLVSLGTMMFGKQTSETDALSIMDYAFEQGVNFFDTANTYNAGESERIVGKWLKNHRDELFLATKVSGPAASGSFNRGLSRRNILAAVDASLKRLDTDYIDLYYMHVPDHETEIEESLHTFSTLVESGKIRYVGISNYAAWEVADMLAVCDKRGYTPPVVSQNVYNPITRGIEPELIPCLLKHKLGLVVYNPIAGGLLAGKHKPGTPAANTRFANQKNYYDRYWSDENFAALEQLTEIARDEGISILEFALRWCWSRSGVTSIISGVSKLEQLKQNLAFVDGKTLSLKAQEAADSVWQSLAGTRFAYHRVLAASG
jgi:aryl-alcohol dehydrogenase-like predicted oxidoreductase